MSQVTTGVNRQELVRKLSREVTSSDAEPYPELKTALESLVDALSAGKTPGVSPDWPAVVSEAIQLRPQH
jgi:hypothetical protein